MFNDRKVIQQPLHEPSNYGQPMLRTVLPSHHPPLQYKQLYKIMRLLRMVPIDRIHNQLAAAPISPFHRMKIRRPPKLTSKRNTSIFLVTIVFISYFNGFSFRRLDTEQPSTSKSSKVADTEPSNLFNTIAYSSFGKASICSSFSAKSGSSTGNENLDSLLKTISKDPSTNTMANLQESLNDVNSIRYFDLTHTSNSNRIHLIYA